MSGRAGAPVVLVRAAPDGDVRTLRPGAGDLVDLEGEAGAVLRDAVTRAAAALRPDLDAVGAAKATIRFGVTLAVRDDGLAAVVAEAGAEASVEVAVEFTRDGYAAPSLG